MSGIEALPESVVSKLRSGINIPSLPAVLLELVENSLDAGAKRIDCSFDLSRWLVRCDDDGHGMSLDDMRAIGRYCSSKNIGVTYGFRGEALASLADVGLVEIGSRQAHAEHASSIIMRDGQVLSVGRSSTVMRSGTVITVRDIFFKWPVRRKGLDACRSSLAAALRDSLQKLCLVHPGVAFTLTNLEGIPKRTLSVSASRDGLLGRWRQLFGRIDIEAVHPIVGKTQDSLHVDGFISRTAASSKAQQFIFINSRAVVVPQLHKALNALFGRSKFSQHALLAGQSQKRPTSKAASGGERHPIYVFDIRVDSEEVDAAIDPQRVHVQLFNEEKLLAVLTGICSDFLTKEGYTSKVDTSEPAHRLPFPVTKNNSSPAKVPSRKRKRTEANEAPSADPRLERDAEGAEQIRWIDPQTKRAFLVDARTGHSRPAPLQSGCTDCSHQLVDRSRLAQTAEQVESDKPAWLVDLVSSWTNPTFESVDKAVKTLQAGESTVRPIDGQRKISKASLKLAQYIAQVDNKFLLVKVPSDDASAADTVVLVDQHAADERIRVERFFAELVQDTPIFTFDEPLAVLLTRHERDMLLDSNSLLLLRLARWGIHMEVDAPQPIADIVTMQVVSVPMLVSDKLRDVSTLEALIKSFLAEATSSSDSAPSNRRAREGTTKERPGWLSALSNEHCPRALIELVNSRACRGAIMFNDRLTDEQGRRMLKALSETVFPFQCAHARPSLVPLFSTAPTNRSNRDRVDWDLLRK